MTRPRGAVHGRLACEVFDSITEVDKSAWRAVWDEAGGTIFADPRFLRATEESMRGSSARLWHVLMRDGSGRPVASATMSVLRVPLGVLASGRTKQVIDAVSTGLPRLMRPRVLLCGLPVSAGECNLLVAPVADHEAVLATLTDLMLALARRAGATLLCCKEFTATDRQRFQALTGLGWFFAEVPAMNHFEPRHPDFPTYLAALRAHRRHDIRRSLRKAERAHVLTRRLRDPEVITQTYTEELHRLYCAVVGRSSHQLELLPVEFFHALARAFPEQVELVLATIGDRAVAFNWSLTADGVFHLLFCGIDYDMNHSADLYFNIMYAELDRALRVGVRDVQMGQTADTFKARIGCRQQPRYICVRSRSAAISRILRASATVLAPRPAQAPKYDLFR